MRLTKIDISNAIGCRRFAADTHAPIQLLAGPNGAGKSSIVQAVRYALTGDMPRVSLKKDGEKLVTEGARTGSIAVQWDGGEAVVTLPDCKLVKGDSGDIHAAMPFVCEPHVFANIAANDRRAFLFNLTGTMPTAERVHSMMLDRGCVPDKIEAVIPLLRSSFPAACAEAKKRATEAKGAWRGVTGETYGDKKAASWKAEKPAYDAQALAAAREALKATEAGIEAASARLGSLRAAEKGFQQRSGKLADLREHAGRYARIADKLQRDEKDLAEWERKVTDTEAAANGGPDRHPLACPHCGGMVELHKPGVAPELRAYEMPETPAGDPEAKAKLPEYRQARDLLKRSVENGRRDLAAANAAAEELRALEQAGAASPPDANVLAAAEAHMLDLREEKATRYDAIRGFEEAERAAQDADKKTTKANGYAADVAAWDRIADALAPDGIPGELLAQAMKPINGILAQSAADTGWMQVAIDADMNITAAGRPYALLSESEQWRCDAMLAAAIAQLSGLKLMLLDRMDVLDIEGRGQALGWLVTMAEAGEIETCIVAATLKAIPAALPNAIEAHWIEAGRVDSMQLREAA